MNFYNVIGEALTAVIEWVKIIYQGLCDWLGLSEWAVFFTAITIILIICGIKIYKHHH